MYKSASLKTITTKNRIATLTALKDIQSDPTSITIPISPTALKFSKSISVETPTTNPAFNQATTVEH
jgi:hypothetical protein